MAVVPFDFWSFRLRGLSDRWKWNAPPFWALCSRRRRICNILIFNRFSWNSVKQNLFQMLKFRVFTKWLRFVCCPFWTDVSAIWQGIIAQRILQNRYAIDVPNQQCRFFAKLLSNLCRYPPGWSTKHFYRQGWLLVSEHWWFDIRLPIHIHHRVFHDIIYGVFSRTKEYIINKKTEQQYPHVTVPFVENVADCLILLDITWDLL